MQGETWNESWRECQTIRIEMDISRVTLRLVHVYRVIAAVCGLLAGLVLWNMQTINPGIGRGVLAFCAVAIGWGALIEVLKRLER